MYTVIVKLNLYRGTNVNGRIRTKKVLGVKKGDEYFYYEKLMLDDEKVSEFFYKFTNGFGEYPEIPYQVFLTLAS